MYSHEEITYQPLQYSEKGINGLEKKKKEKYHKDLLTEKTVVLQDSIFHLGSLYQANSWKWARI